MTDRDNPRHNASDSARIDARLDASLNEWSAAPPSAALQAQIRAEIGRDLTSERPWSHGQRALVAAGLAAGSALLLALALARNHETTASKVLATVLWLGFVVFTLRFGVADYRAETRRLRWSLAVAGLMAFYAFLLGQHDSWLPLPDLLGDHHSRHNFMACGGFSLAIGFLCFTGTLWLWRRSDPFNPELSGVLAGLTAGIAGAAAACTMCRISEGWHLLLAHGLVVGLLVGAGYWLGRRVLAP